MVWIQALSIVEGLHHQPSTDLCNKWRVRLTEQHRTEAAPFSFALCLFLISLSVLAPAHLLAGTFSGIAGQLLRFLACQSGKDGSYK